MILLLAGVGYALAGIVPGSGGRLADVSVGWLVVAIGSETVSLVAYSALFYGVFGPGQPLVGVVRSAQIAVGELGAFAVVPTGAGGPILRVWALLASGLRLRTLLVRSVVHAVIFNLPYILVAGLLGVSVVLDLGPGDAPVAVALAPLGVVLITLAVAVGASGYARRRSAKGEPRTRWERLGSEIVQAIPEGLHETRHRLRDPRLLLAAIAYWAGDCGVLVIGFHAVHGSAPVGVIVLAYLLGQLGNALPLPGGVGGVEPLMLGVFTASGVTLSLAAAAIVIYRFISLGLQAVTGSVAVASLAPALENGSRTVGDQLRAFR